MKSTEVRELNNEELELVTGGGYKSPVETQVSSIAFVNRGADLLNRGAEWGDVMAKAAAASSNCGDEPGKFMKAAFNLGAPPMPNFKA